MSWSVTITPPPGFPDVQEPVVSFSSCPGNLYTAVREKCARDLQGMQEKCEAMDALRAVLEEIDKGNHGLFSDDYAVKADIQWSGGKSTQKVWDQWRFYADQPNSPFKTYEGFCGWQLREDLRKDAVRFFLYYAAGYKIDYTW